MTRPVGQPGTFVFGCETFEAIHDRDGQYHWRGHDTGAYYPAGEFLAQKIADRFVPDDVPEWVAACEHDPVCSGESECDRQATEDDLQSRAEADR